MKNKPLIKLSALAAMAILVAVAFVGLPTTADDICHKGSSYETRLMAGQTIEVGTVTVWIDSDSLHVEYEITAEGWYITETHLALAVVDVCTDCPGDIPTTKSGNPKNGQFAFSEDDGIYDIAFDDSGIIDGPFEIGDCLCIAAHAVVEKRVGGVVVDEQTGWGEGPGFSGKNWAMYFCWEPKYPIIPTGSIGYTIYNPGTNTDSYWDTKITSGASGNVPGNAWLHGWCVETGQTIGEGSHTGTMSIPTGTNWNIVNWILNNKDSYSWESIQAAIWWFVLGKTPALGGYVSGIYMHQDDLDDANELIDAAEHHGDYHGGVWWAVMITCSTANQQEIIVEIDP